MISRRAALGQLGALVLASCDKAEPRPDHSWIGEINWRDDFRRFEAPGLQVVRSWDFAATLHGFVAEGGELSHQPGVGAKLVSRSGDPKLRSPNGIDLPGDAANLVLVRMVRVLAAGPWDGALYYATARRGESAAYMALPVATWPPETASPITLVYDMANPARGGDDWTRSQISQLRLDTEAAPGGVALIAQIALAQRG
ncbi:hypothetical protein [Phenylobacterium sp.]|uniref:hypothetical protein n=1 Tax=Phenylobacterium sp. TaxID=1871053 RepID=UPI003001291C